MSHLSIGIVGGGIVGSTAAYYLARQGYKVTLFDEETGQATKAAAGIICPWFTLRRNKPWYFLVSNGAEFYHQLIQDLKEDGHETNGLYQAIGTLLPRKNQPSLERDAQRAQERLEQSPAIVGVETLTTQQVNERFPLLNSPYPASFVKGGARVDGEALIATLKEAFQQLGGTYINQRVHLKRHEETVSVHTDESSYTFDRLLLASGAWLPNLLEPLGFEVAIRPQKGQLYSVFNEEWVGNNWPVVMAPGKFDIIPNENGEIVIGATHEDDRDYSLDVEMERINDLVNFAEEWIPGFSEYPIHRIKVGIRAYTPDSGVLVGEVPTLSNVWAVSGLGSSGLTSGPFIGHQWSQLIHTGQWQITKEDFPIETYISPKAD